MTRILSTNASSENTVTIDYDSAHQQFVSTKEKYPFSTQRMLRMLNGRAKTDHTCLTAVGRLQVDVGEARCVLTRAATTMLAQQYRQRHDWQASYPFVADVLPREEES